MRLLYVVCFALCTQIRALPLEQLIGKLSERVGASTNIFFGFSAEHAAQDIIRRTSLPMLLITEHPNFELRQSFSSEIVSVVLVEQTGIDGLLDIVKATLNRLHKTDVLFVTEGNVNDMQQWSWLFRWCWEHGFYNVLLTDANGSLLTFDPFPNVQVLGTTLEQHLEQRNNWRDLKGYAVRIAVGNDPPRSLAYRNKKGEFIFRGLFPSILQTFAQRYNATLLPLEMPNLEAYSVLDCLRHIAERKVDVCSDGTVWGQSFAVTYPWRILYVYLMVAYAQPVAKFRYFLTPFSGELWLLIGLSICYITMMTSLIYWKQSGAWHVGKFLLQAISSILYLGFDISPIKGHSYVIIYAILIAAGFLISNLYLALLSSVLSDEVFGQQINSLADIRTHNLTMIVSADELFVLEKLQSAEFALQRLEVLPEKTLSEHRNKLDTDYVFACLMEKCEMYLYQQKFLLHPRMQVIQHSVLALFGGIPMPNAWPFEELLNRHYVLLYENGLAGHFNVQAAEEAIASGQLHFLHTEYYDVLPLSIEYFQMPAILLGFGCLLALMTFIVECIIGRCSESRRQ